MNIIKKLERQMKYLNDLDCAYVRMFINNIENGIQTRRPTIDKVLAMLPDGHGLPHQIGYYRKRIPVRKHNPNSTQCAPVDPVDAPISCLQCGSIGNQLTFILSLVGWVILLYFMIFIIKRY